ncbi:hypothetical protein [Spiroplasma floricola]|uniref:ABC transporter permease n=1 Tax=Spiroplasma floricola 23-6 TaxID=1336749 RepID=A0A2K8SCJ1_9MOLU|nr:hypothetical protein [Spiroplasma floricola]AUB31163.1 ABC transporter permease [Spiroplasma floricola 23-6]
MEKLIKENKIKKENKSKEFKNFSLLYLINLKLSLKNVGSIISGIIFSLITIIFFIIEYTKVIEASSLSSYGVYKYLTFLLGGMALIFHILLNSLYLFKKQVKDGISSIELRAGYKTWKSYLIRVLIIFTVATIYITSTLVIALILNFSSLSNTAFFFNLHYSQVFFFYFLAYFSTIVLVTIMVLFKTSLATAFGMLFMVVLTMAPMFASFKYMLGYSVTENYKTNIKMIGAQDFYKTTKSNQEWFNDNDGSDNSKSLKGINSYLKEVLDPLKVYEKTGNENEGKYNQKIIPEEMLPSWNLKKYIKKNEFISGGLYDYEKAISIIMKNMAFGQVYYNYDVFKSESSGDSKKLTNNYLLETTPIWNLLKDINKTVLDNQNNIKNTNQDLIPSIFVKNLDWTGKTIDTVDMNIDSFSKEMSSLLPQYSIVFDFINDYYNKYKTAIIAESKNNSGSFNSSTAIYHGIMDTPLAYEYNKQNKNKIQFYSWKKFYESRNQSSNNYGDDDFCYLTLNNSREPKNVCDTTSKNIKSNDEMAEVYKKFPELTIINQLIINLWRDSMEFSIGDSIEDGLYSYHESTIKSNTLKTDLFRHFAAMSTGLFSPVLLNDSYNTQSSIFYQGQFLNISNIFDFENYSSENKSAKSPMAPVYEKVQIKKRVVFMIPLAYAMYFILITPLAYVGYIFFNKKAKL